MRTTRCFLRALGASAALRSRVGSEGYAPNRSKTMVLLVLPLNDTCYDV